MIAHTHQQEYVWEHALLRQHLATEHGVTKQLIERESVALMKGRHRILHEQQEAQVTEAVTENYDPISLRNRARSAIESLYMEYHALESALEAERKAAADLQAKLSIVMNERDSSFRREEILTAQMEQLNSRLVGAHEKLAQLRVYYDSLSERLDVQTRMLEERPETFVVSAKKAKKIQRKAREAAERERNAL